MLGKLTFHLFLYKIQSTTHMRLSTYLRSVGQLEEGREGGELSHFGRQASPGRQDKFLLMTWDMTPNLKMCAHTITRLFMAVNSLSSTILSEM